jgi:predicted Holliday junction resolvase-like endonuclease
MLLMLRLMVFLMLMLLLSLPTPQAGLTWEEWQDSAEERAMKVEEERRALEEQRAKEEAIKAKEAAENMDKEKAKKRVAGAGGGEGVAGDCGAVHTWRSVLTSICNNHPMK